MDRDVDESEEGSADHRNMEEVSNVDYGHDSPVTVTEISLAPSDISTTWT